MIRSLPAVAPGSGSCLWLCLGAGLGLYGLAAQAAVQSAASPVPMPRLEPYATVDGRPDWRPRRALASDLGAGLPADPAANSPPSLGRIGPQTLTAGRRWRLHMRVRDADGDMPLPFARELPAGATFTSGENGWAVLEWTPPPLAAGEHFDVIVGATDARDSRLSVDRVLRLEVRDGGARPTGRSAQPHETPAPPLEAPRFEPLAAQIISAGRTVSFRVVATLGDGHRPYLQIDRLPRQAGFYENADGSRTFHWPTGQGDQGEHLFRVSAFHPDDATLNSHVDLLVVVGDPTLSRTMPGGLQQEADALDAGTLVSPSLGYFDPSMPMTLSESETADRDPSAGNLPPREPSPTLLSRSPGALPPGQVPLDPSTDASWRTTPYDDLPEIGELPIEYAPLPDDFGYPSLSEFPQQAPELPFGDSYGFTDDGREFFITPEGIAVDRDGNPISDTMPGIEW